MAPPSQGLLGLLLCAGRLPTCQSAPAGAKPHVLLVLADDYGWGNLGVHRRGQEASVPARQAAAEVNTPNLDALADAGIQLERHYAYKICSPSRSSLQSGRHAVHVNSVNTGVTVQNPHDPVSGWQGIPRNMTGLAQKMRLGGYRTHMVGKWDAGMATPEHTPQGRGYESWLGYFSHANDYWRKGIGIHGQSVGSADELDNCLDHFVDFSEHNETYRGGVRDAVSLSGACIDDTEADPACYEEHVFKQRALSVIHAHDTSAVDSPMFLFYSFHLVHTPLEVPRAYLEQIDRMVAEKGAEPFDDQNRRQYAAMVLYMDGVIGELAQALKARNMWENTLMIFCADNGGPIYQPGGANNHPLKGGKYSDWEGGVRTNAFVSGGFVPPQKRGSVFPGIISISDWYGTLSELARVDQTDHVAKEANVWLKGRGLPLLPGVDSVAQWGFITNGTNGRPGPLHLSEQAVLVWPHKLIVGKQVYSAWQGHVYPNCSTVETLRQHGGPIFQDLKIFDRPVHAALRTAEQDKLTWTHDCGGGCVFDVEADPSEHRDLANDPAYAKTLRGLQNTLRSLNQKLFAPERGRGAIAACDAAVDNGGYYGPFAHIEGYYTPGPKKTLKERMKNEALKLLLRGVESNLVQGVLAGATRLALPALRGRMSRKFDRCLANTTRAPDSTAVPVLV